MKQRGIIMRDWEVRAIREGRKTQKRFIIKPQPRVIHAIYSDASIETNLIFRRGDQRIHCPYGKPGDLLWVRETFRLFNSSVECACYDDCSCSKYNGKPIYRADNFDSDVKWTPSIHMPRWASRISLEIVSVRAQRLHDITEDDAKAEGCDGDCPIGYIPAYRASPLVYHYAQLWESINGPGSWERNDLVFAVEFKEVKL